MLSIGDIRKVAVAGAGTMGAGIALLSAQAGYETFLYDLSEKALEKGMAGICKNLEVAVAKGIWQAEETGKIISRIHPSHQFGDLRADVVIEAIVERLEVKTKFFQQAAALEGNEESIFCSNTSSIPITLLAKGIPQPQRVAGMHFFNPAHIMKLVEIVSGEATAPACAKTAFELALKMGKQPVMTMDRPGFIVNRIGKLFHTEPLKMLEEEVASVSTIDQLLEASGFRMGPFKLIDLIGVDANLNVTKSLYELAGHEPKFKPSPLQEKMVEDGRLGKKSGHGFYDYDS